MEQPVNGIPGISGCFFMSRATTLSPSFCRRSLLRSGKNTQRILPRLTPNQFRIPSRTSSGIFRKPTRSYIASSLTKRGTAGRVGKTPRKESFMERFSHLLLLGALILLAVKGAQGETPKDPIYIKTSNGWNGAYEHGNAYAEFRVMGTAQNFKTLIISCYKRTLE